ncbi:MAG: hypothetical protein NVSMB51_17810 [Solirubrobacteraceae bacterium]
MNPETSTAQPVGARPRLRIEIEPEDGCCRVRPHGEIDLATTAELDAALAGVEARGAAPIELDLGAVTFIDSTGIHLLLRACGRSPGLRIVALSAQVQRLIMLSGIERQLPLPGPDA